MWDWRRVDSYPKEIETALYGHEGVLEVAVVGRPDDVLGEVVVAYVALRPEAVASYRTLSSDSAVCPGCGGSNVPTQA